MNKLFSVLSVSILLLASTIFFITCQKEYSFEGGVGTAVYTLVGEGGECTGNILNGAYYAGTPMGASNTVQLEVNVITIGTYSLSTNEQDGIFFAASGNFTDTGMQAITLIGNGTPSSDGVFMFSTPAASECFFTVTVDVATEIAGSFDLAGAPGDCEGAVVKGNYTAGRSGDLNTVELKVNVTALGPYSITTDTVDEIYFSTSGTFTDTGEQVITLVETGTPALPGNFIFAPKASGSGCTFEVSVFNAEPLAIYVLESGFGTPNPCIYAVAGNYTVNNTLTGSNTVTMHVFVQYAGNFTVSTEKIDGMMFSYTGTFAFTGAQTITLTGTGIPLTPGTFTFAPHIIGPHPLGGETCAFDITVN